MARISRSYGQRKNENLSPSFKWLRISRQEWISRPLIEARGPSECRAPGNCRRSISRKLALLMALSPRQGRNNDLGFLVLCLLNRVMFSSVQFSCSVVSDSLRPHELQHARPPCPSPTPRVYSDSHPSSQWCHPAISSSVVPFSSCPRSLPASESFPVSQLFAWGDQSTGVSALASFLPIYIPTDSAGGFPFPYTLSSIYCL